MEQIEINPYTTVKDVGSASVSYIKSQKKNYRKECRLMELWEIKDTPDGVYYNMPTPSKFKTDWEDLDKKQLSCDK